MDKALSGTRFCGRLNHFAVIDSTNSHALAQAQAGIAMGQVYIADEQTAGRGRRGHTWHSEPDRGLYLTVLVRPALRSNQTLALSMLAGLAAIHAIQQVSGLTVDLRWPNDLVVGTHPALKLGGILTEAATSSDGTLRHAAIGIGINLNQTEFPPELAAQATSVRQQRGQPVVREALATALLQALDAELCRMEGAPRPQDAIADIFSRFTSASSWVHGKRVRVEEGDGYTGTTAGLTQDGFLRVRCSDATERVVHQGGVREL